MVVALPGSSSEVEVVGVGVEALQCKRKAVQSSFRQKVEGTADQVLQRCYTEVVPPSRPDFALVPAAPKQLEALIVPVRTWWSFQVASQVLAAN
ncbi:putative regulation of nuclear pre-mRNA domain-containing protein 1A [Iris pallida]|uniref:Regulation of nuclear pre-mRNA domain-containing protein 1A n=1 Tax=Iris pallida TaxID=29817 RepID=A0AAX6DJA5_IRIPA|nr:putative regulation of nuclear pre-mRNA domain-containing protein 1A [Iris pallida]